MTAAGPPLFDFYVVLDFEATCRDGPPLLEQEIIELPAVLVDAHSNTAVAEFQRYVRPACHPHLSPFCTELTGITQTQVDGARPFEEVAAAFGAWLRKANITHIANAAGAVPCAAPGPAIGGARGFSAAFVTCGDWDLRKMLPVQLLLSGLRSPLLGGHGLFKSLVCAATEQATPVLYRALHRPGGADDASLPSVPEPLGALADRWVNIKIAASLAGLPRPRGMPDLLSRLGLNLAGRHHSGIDDCRNIARCAMALAAGGHRLALTSDSRRDGSRGVLPVATAAAVSSHLAGLRAAEPSWSADVTLSIPEWWVTERTRWAVPAASSSSVADRPAQRIAPAPAEESRSTGSAPVNGRGRGRGRGRGGARSAAPWPPARLLPNVEVDDTRDPLPVLLSAAPPAVVKLAPDQLKTTSKKLSRILRHDAATMGLPLHANGFVPLAALLAHRSLQGATPALVATIAENSDKQRFRLAFGAAGTPAADAVYIRANQGHTIVGLDLGMQRVVDAAEVPVAVHGTDLRAWECIKTGGLSRMARQHIHLARGLPGESGVISGMRAASKILIYIDVPKVLAAGIPIFISENGVILSPGREGVLPPEFFAKVVAMPGSRQVFPVELTAAERESLTEDYEP